MAEKILVINPGATSTKVGVFDGEQMVFTEIVRHHTDDLMDFNSILDQLDYRKQLIIDVLKQVDIEPGDLSAVVGRGGAFKPLTSGTYKVNNAMLSDVREGNVAADHASNLGCMLAQRIAHPNGIPAFIVDPVSVDEFDDIARVSGIPELERRSLSHALNLKATARMAAADLGQPYEKLKLIIAHLGTGISISAHRDGRMVDVNNANDGGPFSPQRSGSLPTTGLIKLCFSGRYSAAELKKRVVGNGGLKAYLGTDDAREAARAMRKGDKKARLVLDAMTYQIAKECGAMAAVLNGGQDAVVVTGGISQNETVMELLTPRLEWLGKLLVYPGEDELCALAKGALRVLRGEEKHKVYR
ncbi:MAG: butyrate kinase [Candidatus Coatesbacteria bacterium]|nr:butyrate kinase [Candidatus Coatesbacteria bacterium]